MTTLHSSSTKGALKRLYDLGVPQADLKEVVQGIVAQKLVEIVCPFCGENCKLHCRMRRGRRRGAIYEILVGDDLHQCLGKIDELSEFSFPEKTIDDWLNKALALGFISMKEWKRLGKGGY
ncbi:ATPase, T2SS/T4P/T4SS family [Salipaludibacillus sp. HK11]|uniref:ATPase, T2SS/T4P/T4SS family n=1 Tax=Salipaludibacillus sp. HK11 TaxID=3394320 RepID=UPI0039FC8001